MKLKKFNPLIFLMSLGAGGISVIPFAFLQYTFKHSKGLIKISHIGHGSISIREEFLFRSLEAVMIIFALLHFILSIILLVRLVKWTAKKQYQEILHDPLKNANLLTPFISIIMTMNVFIGPVRFFIPQFANNLQLFMLPALIAWSFIWVALLSTEINILRISFEKSFDVNEINFGWLLQPFALGMLTVTGTGIAAMSKNSNISHIAAFMSLVSGSMGLFLLTVKVISIFKSHFAKKGLPEKQFMPGFLIVVPNITLYAISAFRFGHYLETYHGMHLGAYFTIVMTTAFAFETWYLLFGMVLMRNFFKKDLFRNEFYVSQWGLVCPFVAYAVLGSFVHRVFIPNPILYSVVLSIMVTAIVFFGFVFIKQIKCVFSSGKKGILCLS